jgi:uncharacterized RDD family membrane protein YckC
MDHTFFPPHVMPPRYPIFRRALAALIDYIFVTLVIITFYRFVELPVHRNAAAHLISRAYLGFGLIFWFIYFPFVEFVFGATIGKWLFGFVVKSIDGSHPLIDQNFKRHLLDIVDVFYFGFAFLMDQRNPELQRLGDKWAGTVVKRVRLKARDEDQFY